MKYALALILGLPASPAMAEPWLPLGFSPLGFWLLNVGPFYAVGILVALWVGAKMVERVASYAEYRHGWDQ